MAALRQLNIRISEQQLLDLRQEAGLAGYLNVSEYARRKLAVMSTLDRIAESLASDMREVKERLSSIEETLGAPSLSAPPGHRQVFSTQFGRMVDVDADGREIPPE